LQFKFNPILHLQTLCQEFKESKGTIQDEYSNANKLTQDIKILLMDGSNKKSRK